MMGRGQSDINSPAIAVKPSQLQRNYREILDTARESDRTIVDTDGFTLIIGSKERHDFAASLADRLKDLNQLKEFVRRGLDESIGIGWAKLTRFEWIEFFGAEDRNKFISEYEQALISSTSNQDLLAAAAIVQGWKRTAEIMSDPEEAAEMHAIMNENPDLDEYVELFPPEEEVTGI